MEIAIVASLLAKRDMEVDAGHNESSVNSLLSRTFYCGLGSKLNPNPHK